jgi:dTMP kinase
MGKSKAPFIVLEGLDGSGTTTQARMLHSRLLKKNRQTLFTFEPTDGPTGKLIRDALTGMLHTGTGNDRILFSERALCLLFAADRLEHSLQIKRSTEAGGAVICDRYILSSLAYQTLDPEITPAWIIETNAGCALPDVTILLKVPADECAARLKGRKDIPTVYEKSETLRAIEKNYEKMLNIYQRHFGPVISIDGIGDPELISKRIVKAISPYDAC